MTTTPNLGLSYMAPNQNDKEVVYNASLDKLDKQIAGKIDINATANTTITLTDAQNDYFVIKITDTGNLITAPQNVVIPTTKRMHVAWNNTGNGYALTFKTTSGSGIAVGDGEKKLIYCDGVNVEFLTGLQTTEYPIDIQWFHSGATTNSQIVYYMPLTRTSVFPAALSGSWATANVAATAQTIFSIKKNGTQFGTCTFAASGTSGTYAAATATSFSPGDILSIHAPATADSTLADIGFNLKISSIS